MRPILTGACLLAALGYSASAMAEITITRAEHIDGILFVQGETSRSNQLVTLDKRYRTRTGRANVFYFRVRYLPPDCSVTIRAGREVHPTRIANCDMAVPRPTKQDTHTLDRRR
jgi:hypothetical protein